MKIITSFLVLIVSNSSFAATEAISMRMRLSVGGREVAQPTLVALPGQPATVSQKTKGQGGDFTIEAVAIDDQTKMSDGILMKFIVTYNEGDQKKIVARPQILATPGQVAEISVKGQNSSESVKLRVLATRVQ